MARPKAKAPSLRYHISGQSVVTIDGRDFYLGKADSAEAFARYAVLINIYQEHGLCLPDDFDPRVLDDQIGSITGLTIAAAAHQDRQPIQVQHLTAAFRRFVAKRYANGLHAVRPRRAPHPAPSPRSGAREDGFPCEAREVPSHAFRDCRPIGTSPMRNEERPQRKRSAF
jgi:hypothetical protein